MGRVNVNQFAGSTTPPPIEWRDLLHRVAATKCFRNPSSFGNCFCIWANAASAVRHTFYGSRTSAWTFSAARPAKIPATIHWSASRSRSSARNCRSTSARKGATNPWSSRFPKETTCRSSARAPTRCWKRRPHMLRICPASGAHAAARNVPRGHRGRDGGDGIGVVASGVHGAGCRPSRRQ